MSLNKTYIGLGSNLGHSQNILEQVLDDLLQSEQIYLLAVSPFYTSSPVDSHGPDYINAVAYMETELSALSLWHYLQTLEQAYGRQRPYHNAPRTLDLDILLFDPCPSAHNEELILPHPRMHLRAFVLAPLRDIAGNLTLAQGSIEELLAQALANGQQIHKT